MAEQKEIKNPSEEHERAISHRPVQPTAELEELDLEIERRILEDSQSAAPDQVSQPPLAQAGPVASALLMPDAELDDIILVATIFVPPLD
jgi:hypothetical protein